MEILFLEVASLIQLSGTNAKVGGMIALAIAVNLLVFAVKSMGALNTGTIIKGALGLKMVMKSFGSLAASAKGMKIGSAITELLLMAGSMLIFIEAFKRVEGIIPE